MANASYIIRRVLGPLWAWEAVYGGTLKARGYGLGKARVRQAARDWLREARQKDLRRRVLRSR
jgi:hypothetical protein